MNSLLLAAIILIVICLVLFLAILISRKKRPAKSSIEENPVSREAVSPSGQLKSAPEAGRPESLPPPFPLEAVKTTPAGPAVERQQTEAEGQFSVSRVPVSPVPQLQEKLPTEQTPEKTSFLEPKLLGPERMSLETSQGTTASTDRQVIPPEPPAASGSEAAETVRSEYDLTGVSLLEQKTVSQADRPMLMPTSEPQQPLPSSTEAATGDVTPAEKPSEQPVAKRVELFFEDGTKMTVTQESSYYTDLIKFGNELLETEAEALRSPSGTAARANDQFPEEESQVKPGSRRVELFFEDGTSLIVQPESAYYPEFLDFANRLLAKGNKS